MASHDQTYRAGETEGQTQEKTGHMMEGVKEKAQQARQKGGESAQAAKDKLSGAHKDTGISGDGAPKTKEHASATGPADAVKGAFGMGQGDQIRE